jgi:hypothetical protein
MSITQLADVNGDPYSGTNPVPTSTPLAASSTGVLTAVPRSNVTGVALAANASRKGATFHNDTGVICYLSFSATSSTALFSVRMGSQDLFVLSDPLYTGVVSAIWPSNGAGNLLVTEFT